MSCQTSGAAMIAARQRLRVSEDRVVVGEARRSRTEGGEGEEVLEEMRAFGLPAGEKVRNESGGEYWEDVV